MGTYYTFYSEVEINGKWELLNPKFMGEQTVTYWNGSRSYFGETCDELREISDGYIRNISDMSSGLVEYFKSISYDDTPFANDKGDLNPAYTMISIPAEIMKELAEKDTKKKAYVPVDELQNFKNGTSEEIYDYISVTEYKDLDKELQSHYEWYEWENETSPSEYCRRILSVHNTLLDVSTNEIKYDKDFKIGQSRLILSIS